MRLRYVGALPTTFVTLGIEVEPGDEFEAPDEAAPGLTGRADIEAAAPAATARRRAAKAAPPADDSAGAVPAAVTEEV